VSIAGDKPNVAPHFAAVAAKNQPSIKYKEYLILQIWASFSYVISPSLFLNPPTWLNRRPIGSGGGTRDVSPQWLPGRVEREECEQSKSLNPTIVAS
jgi:hypothetical protein